MNVQTNEWMGEWVRQRLNEWANVWRTCVLVCNINTYVQETSVLEQHAYICYYFLFLVACSFKLISLFPSIVDEKPMFGAQRKCSEQYICIIKASARTRVQFQCKSYFKKKRHYSLCRIEKKVIIMIPYAIILYSLLSNDCCKRKRLHGQ